MKKRTIANLSACSEREIAAIKLALRHKSDLSALASVTESLTLRQGSSVGAVWLVYKIASRLGISVALGNSRQGKLALWQVIARVIDQGSRLSAVRFGANHAACDMLDLEAFHEEHLYANLDWLNENQEEIENKLARKLHGKNPIELFLYDVTSSYLEGEKNELAAFGYNRDKKRGKQQIVIGLLCDPAGTPLLIEVFPGNTQDTKTFGRQVAKVAKRFGGGAVTFVGDRGMIKGRRLKNSRNIMIMSSTILPRSPNHRSRNFFGKIKFRSACSTNHWVNCSCKMGFGLYCEEIPSGLRRSNTPGGENIRRYSRL